MQTGYVLAGLEATPLHRILDRVLVLLKEFLYRDIGRHEHRGVILSLLRYRELVGALLARCAVHATPLAPLRRLYPVPSFPSPIGALAWTAPVAVRVSFRHE